MKRRLLGAISACAIFAVSVPFSQAMATSVIEPGHENSTLTVYDVASGDVDFTWDQDSEFNITGTEVNVITDNIVFGSGDNPVAVGTVYEFVIPNFFDPLPLKTIMVEMVGSNERANSSDLARVLGIIGADSDFEVPAPALPVDGIFVSGESTSTSAVEFWEMFPNPDFEVIKIFAPVGFNLTGIKISTQSTTTSAVPIPSAVWLFGSGLLGFVGIARRRKTV